MICTLFPSLPRLGAGSMSHSSVSPISGTQQVLHQCFLSVSDPQMSSFFNLLSFVVGEPFVLPERSRVGLHLRPSLNVVSGRRVTSRSLNVLVCKRRRVRSTPWGIL